MITVSQYSEDSVLLGSVDGTSILYNFYNRTPIHHGLILDSVERGRRANVLTSCMNICGRRPLDRY